MTAKQTIIGAALPNVPWENKLARYDEVLWRHSGNPVSDINPIPRAQNIYSSAVIPFNGAFAGGLYILHAVTSHRNKQRWLNIEYLTKYFKFRLTNPVTFAKLKTEKFKELSEG